jgi:hypothetical protein
MSEAVLHLFENTHFWTIIGSMAGIVCAIGAIITIIIMVKHGKSPSPHSNLLLALVESYAKDISTWFSERYKKMQEVARSSDLELDPSNPQYESAFKHLVENIDGFPGGYYLLNEEGTVVHHFTPNFPKVKIVGYNAYERPYFEACHRTLMPIVSNQILSTDRHVNILVAAVPRFDREKNFKGIFDAVIDLPSAPFSEMALSAVDHLMKSSSLSTRNANRILLSLIDEQGFVLGCNNLNRVGLNLQEDPIIKTFLSEKQQSDPAIIWKNVIRGAIVSVKGTPFIAVAYVISTSRHRGA